jgi:hypothetical protein
VPTEAVFGCVLYIARAQGRPFRMRPCILGVNRDALLRVRPGYCACKGTPFLGASGYCASTGTCSLRPYILRVYRETFCWLRAWILCVHKDTVFRVLPSILHVNKDVVFCVSLDISREQTHLFGCVPAYCPCQGKSILAASLGIARAQALGFRVRPGD